MAGYKAVLFSPDGEDYVVDYSAATVNEVWELIDNGGSRWFFYPLPVVIRDNGPVTMRQRVVSAFHPFGGLEGRSLRTTARCIADEQEFISAILS